MVVCTAFAPTLRSGLLQTDPGDTLLNHFILEHSWKCVSQHNYAGTFWSPPCFYPAEQTLAYSENLVGTAPLYWLARSMVEELRAYQFWMMAVTCLTYSAMAWTLSRFGVSPALAALGAACYAFGLPRVNQLCHQQMLASMYSPLAVYWSWQFLNGPTLGRFAFAVAFVVLQLLASVYLGWFLVFGSAAFVGIAVLPLSRREGTRIAAIVEFARRHHWQMAFVVTSAAMTLSLFLIPYIHANRGFHRSYRHEVMLMLPTLRSWVSPPPASLWANVLPPTSGPLSHEHHLFPGLVFIILVGFTATLIAARRRLPPLAWISLTTACALMVFSLRWGRVSCWHVVYAYVPGAQGIRAVTRIFAIVMLFGWIGVLVALSHWLRQWPRFASATGAVLLLVGLGEQYQPNLPAFDARPFFAAAGRIADELRGAKAGYVRIDPAVPYWTGQLAAMWGGLKANVPVVNGYSGRTPAEYPDEKESHELAELKEWLGQREIRMIAAPKWVEE